MAKPKKAPPLPSPGQKPGGRNVLVLEVGTEAEEKAAVAQAFTSAQLSAALIVTTYHSTGTDIAPEFGATMETLREQQQRVKEGDMSLAEAMLMNQAVALQAMFTRLAINAEAQTRLPQLQAITGLALRAQAGCRATLQALGELKYPRQVVFAKQVNNASGPQQVNNGQPAVSACDSQNLTSTHPDAHARNPAGSSNKLLEADPSERMDFGAQAAPGAANQDLEAVGALDRPTQPRRQGRRG